jgi:hypothetical protein
MNDRYLFIVSMDVAPEKEALFNEVYDTEHVPYLMEVKGVHGVRRAVKCPFKVRIGGETKDVSLDSEPKFCAIYEIDDPAVLASDAWAQAVERGRWGSEVRPHTYNRSHILHKVTATF